MILSNLAYQSSLWKIATSPVKTVRFLMPLSWAFSMINSLWVVELLRAKTLDSGYLAETNRATDPHPQPKSRIVCPERILFRMSTLLATLGKAVNFREIFTVCQSSSFAIHVQHNCFTFFKSCVFIRPVSTGVFQAGS